jgi:hypothetical protein
MPMNGTEPTAPVVGPLSRADLYELAWICESEAQRILITDAERANFQIIARKLRYLIEQTTQIKNTENGNATKHGANQK